MGLQFKQTGHLSSGTGPLAIIDFDIVARACASAADGREYEILGEDMFFKYKKDAEDYCKQNNISFHTETHFGPLKEIALSDVFRKALEKRCKFRIAKLARKEIKNEQKRNETNAHDEGDIKQAEKPSTA